MTNEAETNMAVGRAVRGAIAATTHSREDVAVAIGIHPKSLERRILGKIAFTAPELLGIARFCDVSLADLLARVEKMTGGEAA